MNRNVLAVDPGKTTGYWLFNADGESSITSPAKFAGGQLAQWDFIEWMERHLKDFAPLEIVCETFQVTQRSLQQRGERLWSVEQIGILQYLCRKNGWSYTEQSPSDAKNFVSDEKLKRIGWYIKGMEHSRDAARHAVLYAVRQNLLNPLRLTDN